ncbi:MAG: hypothetical protein MZU97_00370 [Bacillus subtilis]|nr:hypothetical protein [Bacillus subtilis]
MTTTDRCEGFHESAGCDRGLTVVCGILGRVHEAIRPRDQSARRSPAEQTAPGHVRLRQRRNGDRRHGRSQADSGIRDPRGRRSVRASTTSNWLRYVQPRLSTVQIDHFATGATRPPRPPFRLTAKRSTPTSASEVGAFAIV